MSYQAIVLILISTLLHATWNMYSKKLKLTSNFFCIGGFLMLLILLPIFIYFFHVVDKISTSLLLILIVSSFFQAIYFIGITKAYSFGKLSLSYPLLRSIPILFVLIYNISFGSISTVSNEAIFASLFIILGCILLPLKNFKDLSLSNYANKMIIFVFLAALGTAGYSILDSQGMPLLISLAPQVHISEISFVYIYMQLLFTSILLGIFILFDKQSKKEFIHILRFEKKKSLSINAAMLLAYAPILVAMTMVSNVAYVVAFRQASIPIAFLMGVFILKENSFPIRYLAIIIIIFALIASALY